MGQIIIDLPLRIKRHYKIDNVDSANELLSALKTKAKQVEEDESEKLTAEDLADIRAARRARKGDFVSWKEVKESLDLD